MVVLTSLQNRETPETRHELLANLVTLTDDPMKQIVVAGKPGREI